MGEIRSQLLSLIPSHWVVSQGVGNRVQHDARIAADPPCFTTPTATATILRRLHAARVPEPLAVFALFLIGRRRGSP